MKGTDLEVRQQTVKEGKGWTEVILASCSENRRNVVRGLHSRRACLSVPAALPTLHSCVWPLQEENAGAFSLQVKELFSSLGVDCNILELDQVGK